MVKLNSHVNLLLETERLRRLKLEANELGTSLNELIRRKLDLQPLPLEILMLRQLKGMLKQ